MKKNDRSHSVPPEAPLVREAEIFSALSGAKGSSLFLGRYTLNEVIAVLAQRNFFREARKRELWPLEFALDSSEHPVQRLQIFHESRRPERLIVDLKVREMVFNPPPLPEGALALAPQPCLCLEWLTLQNPRAAFSNGRTALPGQVHPGLNVSRKVMAMLEYLGRITRKSCLLAFPAYLHNALLFSRFFRFYDPRKEGEVLAIRRAFKTVPFKQLAWAVHLNCLRVENGRTYEWAAEAQLFALGREVREYFESRGYRERVRAARERTFAIDWDCLERKLGGSAVQPL